jgi:hypothetical protein
MSTEIKEGLLQRPHDYAWIRSNAPSAYSETIKAPTTGTVTTISSQTSITPFQWQLTQDVINLSRSTITGNYALVDNAAGGANFMANRPFIDSILLQNASGANIVNLTYGQEYCQVCRLRQMSWDDWVSNQLTEMGNPNRVVRTALAALQAVLTAAPFTTSGATGASVSPSQADIDYMQPQVLRSALRGVAMSFRFQWILGDLFPDTLFGIDCDFRFPEQLLLTVNFAAEQNWYWSALSQADAGVGAAVPGGGVGTLSNLRLHLLTQANVDKINAVRDLCKAGFTIPIPYTINQRYNVAANAGTMSQDIAFGSGNGSELRYIVVSFFDATRTLQYSIDNCNVDGNVNTYAKISSYQSKIGSTLLQVAPLNCTSTDTGNGIYTDYEWNRKLGGDSPLYQSRLCYQQNWHHVDDFRASKPTGDKGSIQKAMVIGGVPLSGKSGTEQIVYNFSATLPTVSRALVMFAFATFTKTLIWHDSMIELL